MSYDASTKSSYGISGEKSRNAKGYKPFGDLVMSIIKRSTEDSYEPYEEKADVPSV